MKLKKIIEGLDIIKLVNFNDADISQLVDNARTAVQGCLFIARRGMKVDSHNFIQEAINKGAVAIIHTAILEKYHDSVIYIQIALPENYNDVLVKICRNFYVKPDDKLKIIGITGTNGKTTTSYLIKSILETAGEKCLLVGTINARIGRKQISTDNTTPGPITLYALYSEAVEKGIKYAVMEISSHAIVQRRLDISKIDIAVFTNLTQDHLDYHLTMEEYCYAKMGLFENMNPDGIAIVNADDLYSKEILSACSGKKILTYNKVSSIKSGISGISFEIIKQTLNANSFIIKDTSKKNITEEYVIKSALIGNHNTYNVLAAYCACSAAGIDKKIIVNGIQKVAKVPGRLEKVANRSQLHIFVDYAHTPDALDNVLNCLGKLRNSNRIITVFGCGGDRDKGKRPKMGNIAVTKSDAVIITSDNPRSEKPIDIIKNIVDGCRDFDNFDIEPDRKKAIEKAITKAEAGDIILIAGKGHETYQIIGDEIIDFDDRLIVKEYLKKRVGKGLGRRAKSEKEMTK